MSEPRIRVVPSGPVEIRAGVWVTITWTPAVTEQRIYFDGATEPSLILRPPPRDPDGERW